MEDIKKLDKQDLSNEDDAYFVETLRDTNTNEQHHFYENFLDEQTLLDEFNETTVNDSSRITVYITDTNDSYDIPNTSVPSYSLTRFFLQQILVFSGVKAPHADYVITELKNLLMAQKIAHLTQNELENRLFHIVDTQFSYPENMYKEYFRLVGRFYAARGALIVFIFGTPCLGRSMTAMRLTERLNIPNIVRTHIVHNVLTFPNQSSRIPEGGTDEEVLTNFKSMCVSVRKGLTADIEKACTNGKSVFIEGLLVDPNLYQDLFCSSSTDSTISEVDGSVFSTIVQNAKFPVVIVPFLLIGPPNKRQIRLSCKHTSQDESTISHAYRSIQTINDYLIAHSKHLNVIHLQTPDVDEVTLDYMHRTVLQHLRQSHCDKRF